VKPEAMQHEGNGLRKGMEVIARRMIGGSMYILCEIGIFNEMSMIIRACLKRKILIPSVL
jgi:hypothetical protein